MAGLDDLFGADGRRLADRLRDAVDWDQRFDSIEGFLAARVQQGPSPTPAVAWAPARLRASAGRQRIEALAAELGCSRRHLSVKFREQVGLSPKTVARLLRFEHVCRQLDADPMAWADIAYASGYWTSLTSTETSATWRAPRRRTFSREGSLAAGSSEIRSEKSRTAPPRAPSIASRLHPKELA